MVNKLHADKDIMLLAIEQAVQSKHENNFPCGAVLVVNGKIIGKGKNEKEMRGDRISHAEMMLYMKYSSDLKLAKKDGKEIIMYTTLEPCLMCFGCAVMHRVDKIFVALPDPLGNMSRIKAEDLGEFYDGNVPQIEYGLCIDKSYALVKEYLQKLNTDEANNYIELFESA